MLAALLLNGCKFVTAIALAIGMAYLSFWAGFVLIALQKLYDWVWEKINEQQE